MIHFYPHVNEALIASELPKPCYNAAVQFNSQLRFHRLNVDNGSMRPNRCNYVLECLPG